MVLNSPVEVGRKSTISGSSVSIDNEEKGMKPNVKGDGMCQ